MKYNSHKEIKDYDPKGDVYMTKARKTTFEERLEIVKYCLENGKSYKLAAEHYEQPYHLIYQWVQKYLEQNEQGLTDNRGRNKLEEELSENDKLKRDKDLLQAKIKRLEIENELLKKLQEIERGEASKRYGKK
jgi:transposase-like protein